jgi:hypothetical protein
MTKRQNKAKITVEELLQSHNPEIRAVVAGLQKLIMEMVPNAAETANPGWHSISYRHPEQGYFCVLFPTQDHVILVFEFGILLPDPNGVLVGDGKQVRNVILYSPDEIPAESIQQLLIEAINLPPGKNDKLELIRSGAKPKFI